MKSFRKAIVLLVLSEVCFAAPAPSDGEPGAKKSAHVKKEEGYAEQLRDLKALIEQQQVALQQVQQELKQTQQQLQQAQQQLGMTAQEAKQAEAKADTVDATNLQVQRVQADLSDVKTAVNTTTNVAQSAERKAEALEHPASIAYKGIRVTPVGFLDLSTVYRTHATNSGPATPFSALPLDSGLGTGVGGLSEFSATARGSRLALRADADAGNTKLAGYFEGDFYGISVANPNQTTSWPFRIRQAWGRASFANGWKITGGQQWNLITMNRRAVDSDAEWIPNTIDTQYLVGYEWGRQAELRIAKSFGNNLTLAMALTDPSYLSNLNSTNSQVVGLVTAIPIGGAGGNNGNGYVTTCTSGSTSTSTPVSVSTVCTLSPTFSTNLAPDIIVKLAYDSPRFGHLEIKGLQRFFRDRVPTTATRAGWNNTGLGGGVGAGAIIPLIAKKVDFVAQGLYGKGISRYQDSGQYDFVVRTNTYNTATGALTSSGGDDNLQAIKSFSVVAGFETHPTPKFEFDLFYGDEYYTKSTYRVTSTAGVLELEGYGAENAANNRNIAQGTAVLWYDVFKGAFGTLRYGAQYEYVERGLWTNKTGSAVGTYKGVDNIGQLSMRYILP